MNLSEPQKLSVSLTENLKMIQAKCHNTADLTIRTFVIRGKKPHEAALLYINNITDTQVVRECILGPLLDIRPLTEPKIESFIKDITTNHIRSESVEIQSLLDDCIEGLVNGKTILIVNGFRESVISNTSKWQQKSIKESRILRSFNGPTIGFTEQMDVNLNLIRNIMKTPALCIETKQVGTLSKNELSILYVEGKVDQAVLDKVRQQLESIDVEYLFESQYIEEVLEGKKSIFPLVMISERPDSVASALYEGKVGIILNGTPHAILVPSLFFQFLQAPQDYYNKLGRLTSRLFTFFSFWITIFLPGIYVAFMKYHLHVLPQDIKEKFEETHTLFPLTIELLVLSLLLHLLLIASSRVAKDLIVVITLVATMVISANAVEAKLIHSGSLVILGISFLTSFLVYIGGMGSPLSTLRTLSILVGHFFGIKGLVVIVLVLIIYMASLKSMGVPYLAPIIPFNYKELKDTLFRSKLNKLKNKPHTFPHDKKDTK